MAIELGVRRAARGKEQLTLFYSAESAKAEIGRRPNQGANTLRCPGKKMEPRAPRFASSVGVPQKESSSIHRRCLLAVSTNQQLFGARRAVWGTNTVRVPAGGCGLARDGAGFSALLTRVLPAASQRRLNSRFFVAFSPRYTVGPPVGEDTIHWLTS